MKKLALIIVAIWAIALWSCSPIEEKKWDLKGVFPVAKGEYKMGDFLNDSNFTYDVNGNLILSRRTELVTLDAGEILTVPDTNLRRAVNLKKISIGDRVVTRKISLGEVAAQAGIAGLGILFNHGKKAQVPALNDLATQNIPVNASALFKSAEVTKGQMVLVIKNEFPVDLTDVSFSLKNQNGGENIMSDVIPLIVAGGSYTNNYSLDGKRLEGDMLADINSMSTPGTGKDSVLVDTSDVMVVEMRVAELELKSAEAIFPAQNLIEESIEVEYNLGGAKMHEMILEQGTIVIEAASTVNDTIYLYYEIPSATLNGVKYSTAQKLNPGSRTNANPVRKEFSVKDYKVDLRGKDAIRVNTFSNFIVARIDSTGEMKKLSLEDSILVSYGLVDVMPRYARGYLGKFEEVLGGEKLAFDLGKILEGDIDIKDLKVKLIVSNGVGAPGELIVSQLKAKNTHNGREVALTWNELGKTTIVPPATYSTELKPSVIELSLDGSNSNIKELLRIAPNEITYSGAVRMNPTGAEDFNQFIYKDSKIEAWLEVEAPMEVGVSGLVLENTLDGVSENLDDFEKVRSVGLEVDVENGLPLSAEMQVYIIDMAGNKIDSFISAGSKTIEAAVYDRNLRKVVESRKSTIRTGEIPQGRYDRLFQGYRTVMRIKLNTVPAGELIKLNLEDLIKVNIRGKAKVDSDL